MALQENQWGECPVRLGSAIMRKEQTGLEAFCVSDRRQEMVVHPQINMSDVDYA